MSKDTNENSAKFLEQMDQQAFEAIWKSLPLDEPDFDESTYADEDQGVAYRTRFSDPRTKEATV